MLSSLEEKHLTEITAGAIVFCMSACVFTASSGVSGKVVCLTKGKSSSSTNYLNLIESKSKFVFLWFRLFRFNVACLHYAAYCIELYSFQF